MTELEVLPAVAWFDWYCWRQIFTDRELRALSVLRWLVRHHLLTA